VRPLPSGTLGTSRAAALHVVDACTRGDGVTALQDTRAIVALRTHSCGDFPSEGAPRRSVVDVLRTVSAAIVTAPSADLRSPGGVLDCLELCSGVLQSLSAGAGSFEPAVPSSTGTGTASKAVSVRPAMLPFETLAAWGRGTLVAALLAAADAILQRMGSSRDGSLLCCVAMQRCVGALANLAQLPTLRPDFAAVEVTPAGPGKVAAAPAPHLQPLLKILVAASAAGKSGATGPVFGTESWLVVLGSVLAALANASLGTPCVAERLCQSGAPIALLGLIGTEKGIQRTISDENLTSIKLRSRAAALLGRLCALPATLSALREPKHMAALTAAFIAAARSGSGGTDAGEGDAEAEAQLQDSLVRAVAGMAASTDTPRAPLSFPAGTLQATVVIMRSQLASLKWPANTPGSGRFIGLGNACKLLGSLLESEPSALLSSGGVDVLVDALKLEGGSSDPQASAVRKNASVTLARVVRDPALHGPSAGASRH